jgi:hypothetical protein
MGRINFINWWIVKAALSRSMLYLYVLGCKVNSAGLTMHRGPASMQNNPNYSVYSLWNANGRTISILAGRFSPLFVGTCWPS